MILSRIFYKRLEFYHHSWLFSLPDVFNKLSLMQENELENLLLDFFDYDKDYVCFPTSSGRVSLEIVLNVLKNIPKYNSRDEVILPSYACKGIIDPILNLGLKPIFVDINQLLVPDTEEIIKKISKSTLACYIHNIFGNDAYNDVVHKEIMHRDIVLLDDHCQSLYLPKKKYSNVITFFSFCYGKTLPATCGGAIITKEFKKEIQDFYDLLENEPIKNSVIRFNNIDIFNKSIKEKITKRVFGINNIKIIPNTYHKLRKMNKFDESIILLQWNEMVEKFQRQKENYRLFSGLLKKIDRLKIANNKHSSMEFLPLIFENENLKVNFSNYFYKKNIEVSESYVPIHVRFKGYNLLEDLENTNNYYKRVVCFPIRSDLELPEINRIKKTLINFIEKINER
jgi:dTDP-4-amino-4,6-dideoxygalactose transaminase